MLLPYSISTSTVVSYAFRQLTFMCEGWLINSGVACDHAALPSAVYSSSVALGRWILLKTWMGSAGASVYSPASLWRDAWASPNGSLLC